MKTQALVLLACSQIALAGEIDLIDKKSGKVVASISKNSETEFAIEGKTYVAKPKASVSEKLARTIVIPRFDVKGAHLSEVVMFLQVRIRELSRVAPLNITIGHKDLKNKEVDLSMNEASCYAILTAVAEYVGCAVAFEEGGAVFRKKEPSKQVIPVREETD